MSFMVYGTIERQEVQIIQKTEPIRFLLSPPTEQGFL